MSEFNTSLRNGEIKAGYDFDSVAEVTHLWGLTAKKLPFHNYFRVPGRHAIASLLTEEGGKGWRNAFVEGPAKDSRGWNEVVAIEETNVDEAISGRHVLKELKRPGLQRVVFRHLTRDGSSWYKFAGVFALDVAATEEAVSAGRQVCVYTRVADACECPKAELSSVKFTDFEFRRLKGFAVECRLADELQGGKSVKDSKGLTVVKPVSLKALPGMQFKVTDADGAALTVVPVGMDEAGAPRFQIGRRELELGYFRKGADLRTYSCYTGLKPKTKVPGAPEGLKEDMLNWMQKRFGELTVPEMMSAEVFFYDGTAFDYQCADGTMVYLAEALN